ncbi:MAG TPA: hypothetical protein VJ798_13195 [Rhizomicrobium sp.]|nr:hypothetical protein [Rhizomicrobium sp.]
MLSLGQRIFRLAALTACGLAAVASQETISAGRYWAEQCTQDGDLFPRYPPNQQLIVLAPWLLTFLWQLWARKSHPSALSETWRLLVLLLAIFFCFVSSDALLGMPNGNCDFEDWQYLNIATALLLLLLTAINAVFGLIALSLWTWRRLKRDS